MELAYDGPRLARVVDTAGRELRLTHDEAGQIARVDAWAQGKSHQAVTYNYDAVYGDLVAATDALGHAEQYAYDAWHRMTEKTLTNGVRFRYEYDPESGRCTRTWGDRAEHTARWGNGKLHQVMFDVDFAKRTTTCHGNEEPRIYTWNERKSSPLPVLT